MNSIVASSRCGRSTPPDGHERAVRFIWMDHHQASEPSMQLTLRGLDGKAVSLTAEEIAALPHKTISVFNSHTKATETYSGVALADLLTRVGVPRGE